MKLNAECLIWHKYNKHYYYNYKVTSANRQKLSFESEYLPFDDANIFMVDGKDWKQYRYTGKVRIVASNIVYDDKKLTISGICGEKNSKLNEIEIDKPSELIFYIEDKTKSVSYTKLVFRTAKYIFYMTKYLYLSEQENITDLSQFKELHENYYQYIKKVYYAEKYLTEILGADSQTFKVLQRGYSKDINNIYYFGKAITGGADPQTFETQAYKDYELDKNNIYSKGEIISTDAPNFQFLAGILQF